MFDLLKLLQELDVYEKSYLVQKNSICHRRSKPDTPWILPYLYVTFISDHKVVFEASYSSTKAFRFPLCEKQRILCMEVLSETDYAIPEHLITPSIIDITPYMQQKLIL